ncbi:MAG: TIGR03086 family metal-binding protein [Acidimicrobiales bacterium]
MTLTSDQVFLSGLDVFGSVVGQVADSQWDEPSPCAGWTTLDVLGHLGTSIGMGISLLRGEQPTWPVADRPRDLVDAPPAEYWARLEGEVRGLVADADLDLVMDTPMGPRTVADRLAFPAVDLYVHAWDIGHPCGIDVTVPEDVAAFAHGYIDPFPTEMVRGEKGAFGPEVEPPADATPTEAFIAWTGRAPR